MTAVTDAGREETNDRVGSDGRQPLEAILLTPGVVDAVRALVEIMEHGGVTQLDLAHGDLHVRLRGGTGRRQREAVATEEEGEAAIDVPPVVLAPVAPAPITLDGDYVISSPMVGTYYGAPSPGAEPFVQVGDRVETGQTVGIVEAMKIMNEIVAERSGVVAAILVENGEPVEYGSPLIRLDTRPRPAGAGGPPAGLGGLA
jgi:acetyl-CoA carboxylase biotin carboxyl carrier protein